MVLRVRWATVGLALALTSGMCACSNPAHDRGQTVRAADATTPSTAEAPSTVPAGYVPPSPRLPVQTFAGDDAAAARAIRSSLGETSVETQLKDDELVAAAKGICSVASSGGAVASKIDFWAAYTGIPGEPRGVIFAIGTSTFRPRLKQSIDDSRAQQQVRGDQYVPGLPVEAQTDLARFALSVLAEKTPTSLVDRSDARMVLDMRAACGAWVAARRLGAVEAAIKAPPSETTAAVDMYAAFLMLAHCVAEYHDFQAALQNTPAPEEATKRHF